MPVLISPGPSNCIYSSVLAGPTAQTYDCQISTSSLQTPSLGFRYLSSPNISRLYFLQGLQALKPSLLAQAPGAKHLVIISVHLSNPHLPAPL